MERGENTPKMHGVKCRGLAHPAYDTLQSRQESFVAWTYGGIVSSKQLASAGFFYTNLDDKTICFSCGGGIKDWVKGDDPWVEHAFYFSKCAFVKDIKGVEFTQLVQGEKPATLSPEVGIYPSFVTKYRNAF